jgi:O-antigen/teichoic acid export membrane protein
MLATTLFDAIIAVVQLGGLIVLGHFHLLSVSTAYLVIGAACAGPCLGWFLSRQQPLRVVRNRIAADWRHNWAFGRWALASNLIGTTAGYATPFLLTAMHGRATTGLLAACATLANVSNMFVMSLDSFITSKASHAFSEGNIARLMRVLWTAAILFAAVLGAFSLLFIVAGEPIVTRVYGPEFAGAGLIAAILAVGILVNALGNNAGRGLLVIERPRANIVPDVCSLAVTFAVLLAAMPLGALGAAIATLAGNTAGCITRSWAFAAAIKELRAKN